MREHLLAPGLISEEDLALFRVTGSVAEAVEEITTFHRVYHSSRYVGRDWVVRLNHRIPDALVRDLEREFALLIDEGGITQRDALPEEAEGDPDLDHLPRLVFAARRHHFGLRRRLIDRLNRDG